MVAKALPALVAFAAGAGCGLWWAGREATGTSPTGADPSSRPTCRSACSFEARRLSTVLEEDGEIVSAPPSATVEIVENDSPAADPGITAAHEMRRARRATAREAAERRRRDFLSSLNLDLLTAEQRARHVLYLEARETCDAARKEVADLRAAGREVPESLQTRLADAEAVLRADREGELRILREAAVRAAGLDAQALRRLMEDFDAIEDACRMRKPEKSGE